MKIPVIESRCQNCHAVRQMLIADGMKIPDYCPVCAKKSDFHIRFVDPEAIKQSNCNYQRGRKAEVVSVSTFPERNRAVIAVSGSDTEIPTLIEMPLQELIQKDIRLGDFVEYNKKGLLRVLLEKRGGNNAKEAKG